MRKSLLCTTSHACGVGYEGGCVISCFLQDTEVLVWVYICSILIVFPCNHEYRKGYRFEGARGSSTFVHHTEFWPWVTWCPSLVALVRVVIVTSSAEQGTPVQRGVWSRVRPGRDGGGREYDKSEWCCLFGGNGPFRTGWRRSAKKRRVCLDGRGSAVEVAKGEVATRARPDQLSNPT
jgi:hypothetical protein